MSIDPAALLPIIQDTHILARFQFAALSALLYEITITFDQEVKYIWRRRWSWPKFLYLMARYYSLLQLVSVWYTISRVQTNLKLCKIYMLYYCTFGGTGIAMIMLYIVLALRLDALYGRNLKVRWFLWVVTIVGFTVEILGSILLAVEAYGVMNILPPSLQFWGCPTFLNPKSTTRNMIISWTASLLNSTVYFAMLVLRVYLEMKSARHRLPDSGNGQRTGTALLTPLFRACYKDGLLSYLSIEIMLIASIVVAFVIKTPLNVALVPFVTFTSSATTTRLILHLRETAELTMPSAPTTMVTRSMVDFAQFKSGTSDSHELQNISSKRTQGLATSTSKDPERSQIQSSRLQIP